MGGNTFGGATYLPAEVMLALRGTAFHAPFTPYPPPIPSTAVDPATVESRAAAVATEFAGQAMAVLDLIARAPLAQLKSGGVGHARVDPGGQDGRHRPERPFAWPSNWPRNSVCWRWTRGSCGPPRPTRLGVNWIQRRPTQPCSMTWLAMTFTPTVTMDFDGRTIGLLHRPGAHDDAPAARDVLLTVLASLPPGRATTRAEVAPALVWARPAVRRLRQDADDALRHRLGRGRAAGRHRRRCAQPDRPRPRRSGRHRPRRRAAVHAAREHRCGPLRFGSHRAGAGLAVGAGQLAARSHRRPGEPRRRGDLAFQPGQRPARPRRGVRPRRPARRPRRHRRRRAAAAAALPDQRCRPPSRRTSSLRRADDHPQRGRGAAGPGGGRSRRCAGSTCASIAPTVVTSGKSASDTLLALRAAGYLPYPIADDPARPAARSPRRRDADSAATRPFPGPRSPARAAREGTSGRAPRRGGFAAIRWPPICWPSTRPTAPAAGPGAGVVDHAAVDPP